MIQTIVVVAQDIEYDTLQPESIHVTLQRSPQEVHQIVFFEIIVHISLSRAGTLSLKRFVLCFKARVSILVRFLQLEFEKDCVKRSMNSWGTEFEVFEKLVS